MRLRSILTSIFTGAFLLGFTLPAIAGGYHPASKTTVRTRVRTYTVTKTPTPAPVVLGTYCLHEPGDDYDLSYNGCHYDGGYGNFPITVEVNRFGGYYHPPVIIPQRGSGGYSPKPVFKH